MKDIIKRNLLFSMLFLVWVLVGGILLCVYSTEELFFAVNNFHNSFLDKLMTVFSAYGRGDSITLLLVSLLAISALRHKHYVATAIAFGVFTSLPIYMLKIFFGEPRPIRVYGIDRVHTVPWLENLYNNSFPSGHTMGAFAFFFFVSYLLPAKYSNAAILFFLIAVACGYSRIYLGQHFFIDVYVGSLLGVLLTCALLYVSNIVFKTKL